MDTKRKYRLHIRHFVIVLIGISVISIVFATICFGAKMPITLAYLTSAISAQSPSSMASSTQSMPAVSLQSVSENIPQSISAASSQSSSESSSTSEMPSQSSSADLDYRSSYPELYVTPVEKVSHKAGDKVVYLTFDDGPSVLTKSLLDILDAYGVKATFFVMAQGKTNESCAAWLKDIVNRGHTLALHTYTHNYHQIYASPQAYLDDFAKMSNFIEQTTGQKVTMFRFPGGSVNDYNKLTDKLIIDEMTRRGYTYYDWNVSSGDAANSTTAANIYNNVICGVHKWRTPIVLMHDSASKSATISQVANIIATLQKQGYRFDKLDPSVQPVHFKVPNN